MDEGFSKLHKILELANKFTDDEINLVSFVDGLAENSLSGLVTIHSLISAYVQNNFLGPPVDFQIDLTHLNEIGLKKLSLDGEAPFVLVKTPALLWIARCLSAHFSSDSTTFKFYYAVCCIEALYLHQHLFGETRSPTLKNEFDNLVSLIKDDDFLSTFNTESFTFLQISCYLAAYYYDFTLCESLKTRTADILGFNANLSAALGTRTQYQQEPLPQLFVQITRTSQLDFSNTKNDNAKPKAVMLQDDTLLEYINFTDGEKILDVLSLAEQAYLLNITEIQRRSHPHDELVDEQCLTFVSTVLRSVYNNKEDTNEKSPIAWPILTEALFKRGLYEPRSYTRAERRLGQLEELVSQYSGSKPPFAARGYEQFFWSRMPSLWDIEFSNAEWLTKMGSFKSALDIYLRWQQWDEVIQCYTLLKQRELAEKVIREQIARGHETPDLYCSLGDVTADKTHYETAWELSKHRSARAMRSLGHRAFFIDRDLDKATDCMEKSLFLNRFQVSLWFTLGCCYMQKKDFKNAERSFRFCVTYEPDNFEAWNNLASAVTFSGDRKCALRLLKEATKWNFENWRIWENILVIALDLGAFEDSIQAYNRMIDLREKHVDAQALGILVKAISQNLPDDRGVGAGRHREKLLKLFGRVTATSPSDAETWQHYAVLLLSEGTRLSTTSFQRAVQCLQRCYQCRLRSMETGWELVKEKRSRLVGDLEGLAGILLDEAKAVKETDLKEDDTVVEASEIGNNPVFLASSLSSLSLNMNSFLSRLKAASAKCMDASIRDELAGDVENLSDLRTQVNAVR